MDVGKAAKPVEEDKPDPPIVVELKKLDDQYLAIEREMDKELFELQQKFAALQEPLLDDRTTVLARKQESVDEKTGTPALKGFWLQALQNHPAMVDLLEQHDDPVLEYLTDVRYSFLSKEDDRSFKLEFHFAENPYFTNSEVWKEYEVREESPYRVQHTCEEIRVGPIDWHAGKDVTVEIVNKKAKGAAAKKGKNKEKKEPRPSFFRDFFRALKADGELPADVDVQRLQMEMEQECDDEDEYVKCLLESDYERGCAVKNELVPWAVRWYTGEACPDMDFDEESEEDDSEDDESEDDDEDESEESPSPKRGAKKKAVPGDKKPLLGKGKDKQEECKQQ